MSRARREGIGRRAGIRGARSEAAGEFSVGWIGARLGPAERRQVTVLCCGLALESGPPAPDPERIADELDAFRETVRSVCDRYGGFTDRCLGPAMLAYWGYPRSAAEPARLAISAALELTAATAEGRRIGCGIDSGLVVAGTAGANEPTVIGAAPRTAQQLCLCARPGEVLVSGAVRRVAAGAFLFEHHGAAEGSWRVLQACADWTRAPDTDAAPVVANEAEMAAIDRLWSGLMAGSAQCLLIGGEAGIGKSTLLRHLGRRAQATGARWIEMQCLPELAGAPLHPVRSGFHELLIDETGPAAAHRASPLDAGDRELLEVFAGTRDRSHAGAISGDPRQKRLFEALRRLLAARAAHAPIVLAFEDLHWADPATRDFVVELGHGLDALGRICLAATWCSGEVPPPAFGARRTTLVVGRLPRSATLALLARNPHSACLPEATRRQIADRSEGVPLFAIELARLWASGIGSGDSDALLQPGSLNAVLSARLDSLGPSKALAQAAAVLGREFDPALLAAVLDMAGSQLAPGIDELVALGFLTAVRGRPGEARRYRFAHALLRDAAYASVLRSRRRELHRKAAEALVHDSCAEGSPEIVAAHFAEAGDPKSAFSWWRKAGEKAARMSAIRAAVDHLRQALRTREHDPGAGSAAEEAEILRMLALQLAALEGNGAPEVVAALQRCIELSPQGSSARFDALWALHACHLVRGEIGRALDIGEDLLRTAEYDSEHERLRVHRVQGLAMLLAGRLVEACAHYRLVLALYDEARHGPLRFEYTSDQGALGYAQLAWGEAIAGEWRRSAHHAQAALALSSRLQHPHTSAHVSCVLAARAQTLGDRQSASALAWAGKKLGEQYEFPYWSSWADIVLGWVQGDDGAGRGAALIESAIEAYQRTGARQALPYALLLLAETALLAGEPEQARAAASHGLRLAQHYGLALYSSELMRTEAVARLRSGAPASEARELLCAARRIAQQQGAAAFELRAARLHGLLSDDDRIPSSLRSAAVAGHDACRQNIAGDGEILPVPAP